MGSWQPARTHVAQRCVSACLQAELLAEQGSAVFMLSGKLADFFLGFGGFQEAVCPVALASACVQLN